MPVRVFNYGTNKDPITWFHYSDNRPMRLDCTHNAPATKATYSQNSFTFQCIGMTFKVQVDVQSPSGGTPGILTIQTRSNSADKSEPGYTSKDVFRIDSDDHFMYNPPK